MYHDDFKTPFSKAILTGLFCGIATTLTCFVFGLIYRSITGFYDTTYVNVPFQIFGYNILLVVIGVIYFEFRKFIPHANLFFVSLFILLTLFCLWRVEGITVIKFRGLLTGIIIIVGIYSAILLPYLYGNKKFLDSFL